MNHQRSIRIAFSIAAASLLAACAGGTDLSSIPVKVSQSGQVSDLHNRTLYTYEKDVAGSGMSGCVDACAKTWISFQAGPQDAPSGDFSIIARDDGARQWAYKGQPIYFHSGDSKELDVRGGKVDGIWKMLSYPVTGYVR